MLIKDYLKKSTIVLFKNHKAGDPVSKSHANFTVLVMAIFKCFIELIPLSIVICVFIISSGSFEINFFSSSDFCLTMVFFQVTSMMEVESSKNSLVDIELALLHKYLCVFFAILFTVIYVFASKSIKLGIPDSYIMYLSLFTLLHVIYLRSKYSFNKYFIKVENNKLRIKQ